MLAAKRAALSGANTVVASGRESQVLQRLCAGQSIGTLFTSEFSRVNARKQWLLGHIQISGSVNIDAGAQRALLEKNGSLLPVGCVRVNGHFHRGELIAVLNEQGREVARGLANYSSVETAKIVRCHANEIAEKLGFSFEDELIHRDNLALHL